MVLLDAGSNNERVVDAQKMRRWVVAQNGWQDNIAVARADAPQPRKVSLAKAETPAKAKAKSKAKAGSSKTVARAKVE